MGPITSYFEIQKIVGENHSNFIYKVRRLRDSAVFILKTPRNEHPHPEERQRYRRELQRLKEFESLHSNVIHAVEYELYDGKPTLLLEYFDGANLFSLPTQPGVTLENVLQCGIKAAHTLHSIHQMGIVHKDVNPSNILYQISTGTIKFIDFGLSSRITTMEPELETGNQLEGTISYISPEQTGRTNRVVDYRTDIYSLGATLYYLLTGRPPFVSDDILKVIHGHLAEIPVTPEEVSSDGSPVGPVPSYVSNVIMKLLEKAPEKRYQSMPGLIADLERCLVAISSGTPIPDFSLGSHDRNSGFQLVDSLFGRDKEKSVLFTAYTTSILGAKQAVLVSGESGIGKTTLIQSLQEPVLGSHGNFLFGKFEQLTQGEPYSGLFQAFRMLIRKILSQDEARLSLWRDRFDKALQGTASVITEAIPEFEGLIGMQEPIPDLDMRAMENRFFTAITGFIDAASAAEHPLVLFLDDMQWCDSATAQLLSRLFNRDDIQHMMLILSYREHEIPVSHPSHGIIQELSEKYQSNIISVAPLDQETVHHWVTSSAPIPEVAGRAFSTLIFQKTRGNPFFIKQLVNAIQKQGFFTYDPAERVCNVEIDSIHSLNLSENVADLLIAEFRDLNPETFAVLTHAAVIGTVFSLNTLVMLQDSTTELVPMVKELLGMGYIQPITKDYDLLDTSEEDSSVALQQSILNIQFRFQHDRIQQAAYSIISEDDRPQLHYIVAQNLLKLPEYDLASVISHLILGIRCIDDAITKQQSADIFRRGATKALRAGAYSQAYDYLSFARTLITDNDTLLEEFVAAAYLSNHEIEGSAVWQQLMDIADNDYRKGELLTRRMTFETYFGRFDKSIDYGISALEMLGQACKKSPGTADVLVEMIKTSASLKKVSPEKILQLQNSDDRKVLLVLSVFSNFVVPAFISGNQNLFAISALRGVQISMKNGLSPASAIAFANYGILLSGMGQYEKAHAMAGLGLTLIHKFDDWQWRAFVYSNYTLFTLGWMKPWGEFSFYSRKTIEAGLQSGDLFIMAHHCAYINLWNPDITIPEALEEGEKLLPQISQQEGGWSCAKLAQQRWKCYAGMLADPASFNEADFQEEKLIERLQEIQYISGLAIYYSYKMQMLYHFGKYKEAASVQKKADTVIQTLTGSAYMEEFCVYSFLISAAVYPLENRKENAVVLKRMNKKLRQMAKWHKVNPHNFSAIYLLMQAEMKRAQGQMNEAETLYRKAVNAENGCGFRYDGLMYELTGRFFFEQGDERFAAHFLQESCKLYTKWGATGKSCYLEQCFNQLLSGQPSATVQTYSGVSIDGSTSSSSENSRYNINDLIDFRSLIQASQAISQITDRVELLHTVMEIVVENTGAQSGYLIVKRQNEWTQAVEKILNNHTKASPDGKIFDFSQVAEEPVLQYTARTRQAVLINDTSTDTELGFERMRVEKPSSSVICVPILHNSQIKGIWYLEHLGVPGSFNRQRLEILNILSPQVAISLTNTEVFHELDMLNATLEQKVRQRTSQLEKKNNQIMESIAYASRIQKALLPSEPLSPPLSDSFIIWQPKDIVGGDFYWSMQCSEGSRLVIGDCTGHGVPGAFMTLNVIALLNQISPLISISEPNKLIAELNTRLRKLLGQDISREQSNDGVDLGIIDVSSNSDTLVYSGARTNLYYRTKGKVTSIKGDRQSAGYFDSRDDFQFLNHYINRGTDCYICSDGYTDQCGGDKGFPFGYRRLKHLLETLEGIPMSEQKQKLLTAFHEYKKDRDQIDDLLFWGGRI